MAIKKDRVGLVKLTALTNEEKKVFVKFLEFERERHEDDINNIDETIGRLRRG